MTADNPFQSLDFLYIPTREVARDAADLAGILGGRVVFAIEEWNTRVAMIAITPDPPHLLLTDHLEGERPILIYRVENLGAVVGRLQEAGWEASDVFRDSAWPLLFISVTWRPPHRRIRSDQAPGHFLFRRSTRFLIGNGR